MIDTPIQASAGQVREDADALREACEPWSFHTGEPPDDDSPLSGVFGAGITYTEHHLAEILGVKDFEKGDGSEDFRTDAGNTLLNILAAAGLYDRDECQFAALASPHDLAVREALEEIDRTLWEEGCTTAHPAYLALQTLRAAFSAPTNQTGGEPYRVGRKVARNVYRGDEPLFMASNEGEAARLVAELNAGFATLSNQTGGDGGQTPAITEAQLHAAMDAYFPGEIRYVLDVSREHALKFAHILANPQGERVRHVKRGFEYEVIGEAEAQVAVSGGWRHFPTGVDLGDAIPAALIYDGRKLTVYRCIKTGKLWCRFTDEFRDGRFEPLPAAPLPSGNGTGGPVDG